MYVNSFVDNESAGTGLDLGSDGRVYLLRVL